VALKSKRRDELFLIFVLESHYVQKNNNNTTEVRGAMEGVKWLSLKMEIEKQPPSESRSRAKKNM